MPVSIVCDQCWADIEGALSMGAASVATDDASHY